MMENSNNVENPKPPASEPPAAPAPAPAPAAAASNAAASKGGGEIATELREILKDNVNHALVCALVSFLIAILLADGFFMMCFLLFCAAACVDAIWKCRADSEEFRESCKKKNVAFFLTLHYGTYERTRDLLRRIEDDSSKLDSKI